MSESFKDPADEDAGKSGSPTPLAQPQVSTGPLALVETAFLASTASLIWLVNFYFPLGPVLRIFFPVPIALVYLRWGARAAWMSALVSGLLLSVLMGPPRSIQFFIPFGLLGVLLGACWRRRTNWAVSIFLGALLGSIGFFFRFWLLSVLLGEDLWVYGITQVTNFLDWVFLKLGLLIEPSIFLINVIAIAMVFLSNLVYLFVVHIASWLLLQRLGNPIPQPPHWLQVILDYEE
ncbi:MAG: DUF2232 domain-containing protein [Phormidium sp.]